MTERDLNNDGISEFVFEDDRTGIKTVTDRHFGHPVTLPVFAGHVTWVSDFHGNSLGKGWLIRYGNQHYTVEYIQNPWWNFRYGLFLVIILFFWLLIYFIARVQSYKLLEK